MTNPPHRTQDLTGARFGTVPAVLLGGVGTIVVALLWMRLFSPARRG